MTLQAAQAHLARLNSGSSTLPNARVIVSSTSSIDGDMVGSLKCFEECFLEGNPGGRLAGSLVEGVPLDRPFAVAAAAAFAVPPGDRCTYLRLQRSPLPPPSGVIGRASLSTEKLFASKSSLSACSIAALAVVRRTFDSSAASTSLNTVWHDVAAARAVAHAVPDSTDLIRMRKRQRRVVAPVPRSKSPDRSHEVWQAFSTGGNARVFPSLQSPALLVSLRSTSPGLVPFRSQAVRNRDL